MSNVVQVPASTANYTAGRLGYKVSGVIIHTMVGTLASCDATFKNPARGASAHYGIACDGSVVHQYVGEQNIAWHCGRFYTSAGNLLANCNTIGIEHCDNGHPFAPRSDAEYACSAQLVREICKRYGIPIDRTHIRMHREVSVAPTGCPDTLDINRIVREAAAAPAPQPPHPQEDDMLLTGPLTPFAATFKAFVAGSKYRDPLNDPRVAAGTLGAGAAVIVDGYVYSSSPVQSADLSTAAGNQPGPDSVWWHLPGGAWVPDAILDTSSVPNVPAATPPAGTAWSVYDPARNNPPAPPSTTVPPHHHEVTVTTSGSGSGSTGPAEAN